MVFMCWLPLVMTFPIWTMWQWVRKPTQMFPTMLVYYWSGGCPAAFWTGSAWTFSITLGDLCPTVLTAKFWAISGFGTALITITIVPNPGRTSGRSRCFAKGICMEPHFTRRETNWRSHRGRCCSFVWWGCGGLVKNCFLVYIFFFVVVLYFFNADMLERFPN